MMFTDGHRLGHYEIERLLGAGGMGEVYRARDIRLRRAVAVKVLQAGLVPDARRRLLREARAASGLGHPHICAVHSVEEADGIAFIVMELVPGQPLHTRIGAGLPAAQVRAVGAHIARALQHAHDHGVLHRDLKSSNVMLTDEGQAKVVVGQFKRV